MSSCRPTVQDLWGHTLDKREKIPREIQFADISRSRKPPKGTNSRSSGSFFFSLGFAGWYSPEYIGLIPHSGETPVAMSRQLAFSSYTRRPLPKFQIKSLPRSAYIWEEKRVGAHTLVAYHSSYRTFLAGFDPWEFVLYIFSPSWKIRRENWWWIEVSQRVLST